MYLEDVLTWVQTLPIVFKNYKAGEKLPEHEDGIGVYILCRKEEKPVRSIGPMQNTSYATSSIRFLLQGEGTSMDAQRKATDLYHVLEESIPVQLGSYKIITSTLLNQEPQPHEKDESGKTYEIDFSLLYER